MVFDQRDLHPTPEFELAMDRHCRTLVSALETLDTITFIEYMDRYEFSTFENSFILYIDKKHEQNGVINNYVKDGGGLTFMQFYQDPLLRKSLCLVHYEAKIRRSASNGSTQALHWNKKY